MLLRLKLEKKWKCPLHPIWRVLPQQWAHQRLSHLGFRSSRDALWLSALAIYHSEQSLNLLLPPWASHQARTEICMWDAERRKRRKGRGKVKPWAVGDSRGLWRRVGRYMIQLWDIAAIYGLQRAIRKKTTALLSTCADGRATLSKNTINKKIMNRGNLTLVGGSFYPDNTSLFWSELRENNANFCFPAHTNSSIWDSARVLQDISKWGLKSQGSN